MSLRIPSLVFASSRLYGPGELIGTFTMISAACHCKPLPPVLCREDEGEPTLSPPHSEEPRGPQDLVAGHVSNVYIPQSAVSYK